MLISVFVVVGVAAVAAVDPSNDDTARTIQKCRNQHSDFYFLLDASSSVIQRDFEKVRDFTVAFVEKLDIAPNATRVGLGIFADYFVPRFRLNDYTTTSGVVNAVRKVPYTGGGTYTGRGLRGMRVEGFQDDVVRKNATKIGVVITDGRSRHRTNTITEAAQLKDKGVWLFAIGVGAGVDQEELSTFASKPHTEFLRHVTTFADLSSLTNDLAFTACRLQPPHADNATCGRRQKADILFVYNAAAMTPASVTYVQTFTEGVIQAFSMTSGNVRVGVVSEGRQGGDIALSEYIRREDFVRALKHQPRSELAALVRKARQQGYEPNFGGRPNSKKFAIIFVDDVNVSTDTLVQASMMKYSDVIVYVIEVGLPEDKQLVRKLPSSPSDVSEFGSYAELQDKTKQDKFVKNLCNYL